MAYFPVFVNMDGKKCLVVGGGKVACRKVKMLLDFGLQVTVIAPIVSDEIKALGQVTIVEQQIKLSLIKDYYLVIAATDQVEINRKIAEECKKNNKLVNVVNAPEFGDFICPAYLKSGNVVAAFSSGGSSPVIAQYLKETVSPVITES